MDLRKICKWIVELNTEKKKLFNDYFIDDIVRYLEIDELPNNIDLEKILKGKCGSEYLQLIKCKNKSDVKKWLNKITNYIAKYIDSEQIIADYFSK
jgi:hypothetical protein